MEGEIMFINDPSRSLGVIGAAYYREERYSYEFLEYETAVDFIGSRWVDYGRARESLSGSASPVMAQLTLATPTDGELLSTAVRIFPDNTVQVIGEYAGRLTLQLSRDGTFRGSLNDPVLGAVLQLSGAILQDRQAGRGYWSQSVQFSPAITGDVRLELSKE